MLFLRRAQERYHGATSRSVLWFEELGPVGTIPRQDDSDAIRTDWRQRRLPRSGSPPFNLLLVGTWSLMTSIRITRQPLASIDHGAKQTARPLTHHQILALVGPFSRRGRHLDLTASQREERRLVFRPLDHPAPGERLPALRELLMLEVQEEGNFRLVRTLTSKDPAGSSETHPTASLTASGPDLDLLLEQMERVPVERHFRLCGGVPIALSFSLEKRPKGTEGKGASWLAAFTQARAQVRGVVLEVDADPDPGMPLKLRLRPAPGQRLQIPQDLLAVLGGGWRPLEELTGYWRGALKVRLKEPARTPEIESRLCRALAHLSETLEAPPERFHERFRRMRWKVTLVRAIPLLTALGIIAATPAVTLLPMGEGSVLRMLIFHAPPLMLIAFFVFKELPRIEIPPLPRRLRNTTWLVRRA